MSKVICDVCGTAYPETSAQCPICGCARTSSDQTAAADAGQRTGEENVGYTYVKGGRFSKKNVRKRNAKTRTPERRGAGSSGSGSRQEEEKTNVGLIAVVILLLLAIVAVMIYIGVRVFAPQENDPASSGNTSQNTNNTGSGSAGNSDPTGTVVPCTAITLSNRTIELLGKGETYDLIVAAEPVDTTDVITFESSDKEVAIVSDSGTITAVGFGEATITVTCGSVAEECRVVCSFGGTENSDPTQPTEFTFVFNTKFVDESSGKRDITFTERKQWKAYTDDLAVDPSEITWTSDNPSICTIKNGIVTVVGPGTTEIHAEYGGKTYTCIVRSKAPKAEEEPAGDYTISHGDVTLYLNVVAEKSFTLTLKDKDGKAVDVTWIAENPEYVTIAGNKITALALGTTNVYAEHEGVKYTCIVRVRNKT
ncbi:MAG: Ig-like domain-containing protein [Oscillospiraceae bacterium]|nr:Ig-like domain-containing protein [Oscillospiraceae bacterium]